MKRARPHRLKPRNPLVAPAQQKKAGVHQRKDKHAGRARQDQLFRKELSRSLRKEEKEG